MHSGTFHPQVLANIEAAQRNNRLFSALKEGNSALAQLQKQVTLEDVERLNDESADTKEYQERLRDLLGESLSAEEDAAALEELEEIQASDKAHLSVACLSTANKPCKFDRGASK